MVKFVITVCLLVFCANADGACTFPSDLTGTWVTSTMGSITFTTSQVTIPSVYTYGDLIFDCDTLDGTQYLLRSTTTVTVLGNQLDVVTCFNDVTMLTTGVKYKLQHATAALNDASGWRLKVLPTGTSLVASTLCDESTPYATGTQDILIKDGSASSAYIQCPDALLGTFSYTYDAGSGDVCSSGSYLDVCTDITAMTFDLSICSQKVAYSSGGVVNCVYSQTDTSTSTTYVAVYNNDTTTDESTTYRYTCLAVSATGTVVNVTQSPRVCQSDQNATYVATGATLQLTANHTCVPSDSTTTAQPTAAPLTGNTAGIAVGVSFAIIVLVGLVVLFLFLFCGKKRMRLYKSICGGKCVVCCSETQECMQFTLLKCCGCLSWTKMILLRCYECCCPECSQGRVEPSGGDVESGVIVTVTPPADEKKDSFMPLPPSVEEVGPVDSQGNPRRLPPLEPNKTSPMSVIEEEPDETPSSPTKLPAISPRSELSQDASDGKMEPEEKVEELKPDEHLVAVAGEEGQGQETKTDELLVAVAGEVQDQEAEGEVTKVKELKNVEEAGVVKEEPTVDEGKVVESVNEEESTPAESSATPAPPETTPDQPETAPPAETAQSDQPKTPSETTTAQPTQQTTAARELDLQPVEHSTPRD